jgi:hypothetical protein
VRSASGDDGRKLFQHVGHRGPVYKGLGANEPVRPSTSLTSKRKETQEMERKEKKRKKGRKKIKLN